MSAADGFTAADREMLGRLLDGQRLQQRALDALHARNVRIEIRVSKLLVNLGLKYDGTEVVRPERLPVPIDEATEPAA